MNKNFDLKKTATEKTEMKKKLTFKCINFTDNAWCLTMTESIFV